MLVDDGFSILDTECVALNNRQTVREVKVVKVDINKIVPNCKNCGLRSIFNRNFFKNFTGFFPIFLSALVIAIIILVFQSILKVFLADSIFFFFNKLLVDLNLQDEFQS